MLLYNYESKEERETAVFLEEAEIAMDRAALAVDTCKSIEEINMREAELKCIQEDGDGSDLSGYYEEAADATSEKKEGLIKKAWTAICNFFKAIKEKLFGSSDNIDDNATYDVRESDLKDASMIQKIWADLKNFSKHPIKTSIKIVVGVLAMAGGLAILTGGANMATKKISGKSLKQILGGLKKTNDEMTADAESKAEDPKKAGDEESDSKTREAFNKVGKGLRGVVASLRKSVSGSKVGKSIGNKVDGIKEKSAAKKRAKEAENVRTNALNNAKNVFSMESAEEDVDDIGLPDFESADDFDDLLNMSNYEESASDDEVSALLYTL